MEGELWMDKYARFKLKIDAKPSLFHKHTVRKVIGGALWGKIRKEVLRNREAICSICGYQPHIDQIHRLHVHEIEEYDFENIVVKLIDLDLICVNCHAFHHFGFTQLKANKEKMKELKQHFASVNKCTIEDFEEYRKSLMFKRKTEGQSKAVKINCSLSLQDISSGNYKVMYAIIGEIPFKEQVIERLKQKDVYYAYD